MPRMRGAANCGVKEIPRGPVQHLGGFDGKGGIDNVSKMYPAPIAARSSCVYTFFHGATEDKACLIGWHAPTVTPSS